MRFDYKGMETTAIVFAVTLLTSELYYLLFYSQNTLLSTSQLKSPPILQNSTISAMMERTYGRRKPGIPPRTPSNSLSDTVSQTEYLSSSSSPDIEPFDYPLVPFFSQESSSTYREDHGGARREKRARNREAFAITSTLLEAQEFGELMEHEDEVNFALDGLRKGQQVRIRRGSLSSLLAICASQHQRRSLRAQGYNAFEPVVDSSVFSVTFRVWFCSICHDFFEFGMWVLRKGFALGLLD